MDMERPQCGSQGAGAAEEYPLGTHVGGLFAVLAVSCLGAGFPVAAKKIKWLKMPPKVFFACKHFGTGVLVATAFVHLLPTAFGSLTNPCLPPLFTDIYPAMPGVIMMTAMLALFMVELYLNAKTGGHSHGGPTGTTITVNPPPPRPQRPFPETANFKQHNRSDSDATVYEDDVDYEKAMARELYEKENQPHAYSQDYDSNSTMPAWFVVFYEQYIRQRSEMMDMIQKTQYASQAAIDSKPSVEVTESYFDEENQAVDPAVYKKMATHITLLEGGILFHSVFVGMTIAMTTDGLIVLLTAIMFHQMFEGLGLGSRIAAVPYPKGSIRPWILVFAFGCTAPIGQAIGIASRNSYDPEGELGLILVGVFNSISSGLLIYAALVNLMVEDFLSEEAQHLMKKKDKIAAMAWLFLGAFGMSVVGAFA
ncbi:Zinc/iron permease [Fusarium tricinctum]|uniref:Zinc/iron permease n=1 Tax=Fusarium tricinctum TaxID=61284 RepID=A0A8K0W9F0_9HYPO|nr:Zinc/iron permease [Fusarium tricinctum]